MDDLHAAEVAPRSIIDKQSDWTATTCIAKVVYGQHFRTVH
jgi:hypothetical protein